MWILWYDGPYGVFEFDSAFYVGIPRRTRMVPPGRQARSFVVRREARDIPGQSPRSFLATVWPIRRGFGGRREAAAPIRRSAFRGCGHSMPSRLRPRPRLCPYRVQTENSLQVQILKTSFRSGFASTNPETSYDFECLRRSQRPSKPEESKRTDAGSGVAVGGGAGESGGGTGGMGGVGTVVPPRIPPPPPPPPQPPMIGGTKKPPPGGSSSPTEGRIRSPRGNDHSGMSAGKIGNCGFCRTACSGSFMLTGA